MVMQRNTFTSPADIYESYRKYAVMIGVTPLSFEGWSRTTFKLDEPTAMTSEDATREWLDAIVRL